LGQRWLSRSSEKQDASPHTNEQLLVARPQLYRDVPFAASVRAMVAAVITGLGAAPAHPV
jgi:hypothetical protein